MSDFDIQKALNLLKKNNKTAVGIVLNGLTRSQLWTGIKDILVDNKENGGDFIYGIPFVTDYRIKAKTEIFYDKEIWLDKKKKIEEYNKNL